MATSYLKDPSDSLDYGFDYTNWLDSQEGETITDSSWVVPTGLTKDLEEFDGEKTKVWLSGGQAGDDYVITNTIVTNSNPARTKELSLIIKVRNA